MRHYLEYDSQQLDISTVIFTHNIMYVFITYS